MIFPIFARIAGYGHGSVHWRVRYIVAMILLMAWEEVSFNITHRIRARYICLHLRWTINQLYVNIKSIHGSYGWLLKIRTISPKKRHIMSQDGIGSLRPLQSCCLACVLMASLQNPRISESGVCWGPFVALQLPCRNVVWSKTLLPQQQRREISM